MSTTTAWPQVSEDTHLAAEAAIKRFKYEKPAKYDRKKVSVRLAQGDLVRGMIQVAKEGGENNLHYHANVDGFWMVLSGKVRFYGPGDTLIAELGPREGLVIPRYARYWFENAGDEELEILLVQAFANGGQQLNSERIDASAPKLERAGAEPQFSAEVPRG
jgi:mannose-6-phosphate isomerase-like protein (cupin superfamily)